MPKVGKKKFPYDFAGMRAAEDESKKTGKPVMKKPPAKKKKKSY